MRRHSTRRLGLTIGLVALLGLATADCQHRDPRVALTVQRLFGDCRAHVPKDQPPTSNPDGECEVITALLDQFERENPDIRLDINTVAWPGYDQLSAQIAADDAPDLVTMHMAVVPDYEQHHLIMPMGAILRRAGVTSDQFTPVARRAITMDGDVWGLPFDTWTQLFHINMNLFEEAGLVRNGQPVLPRNAAELLVEARQFKARTGKPYFVQSLVNEDAAYARNLYTYLIAEHQVIFPDPRHVRLDTPEARAIVDLFKEIYDESLTTRNQDYVAATAAFVNGGGGVYIDGTWMIGTFDNEAGEPGRPLYRGYAVKPYPVLFGDAPSAFVDGHAWVMPVKARTPAQMAAITRLIRFLAQNEIVWTRSGHLSSFQRVIDSSAYQTQPHRRDLMAITAYGQGLPRDVQRQFAIQSIVSEEMAAAITGAKPVERALRDAEHRVDDMLENLS